MYLYLPNSIIMQMVSWSIVVSLSVVSVPNIYQVKLIRPGRSPGKAGNTTRRKYSMWKLLHLNPFKLNGMSHRYQLDQFISNFRGVGGIFHFSKFQC